MSSYKRHSQKPSKGNEEPRWGTLSAAHCTVVLFSEPNLKSRVQGFPLYSCQSDTLVSTHSDFVCFQHQQIKWRLSPAASCCRDRHVRSSRYQFCEDDGGKHSDCYVLIKTKVVLMTLFIWAKFYFTLTDIFQIEGQHKYVAPSFSGCACFMSSLGENRCL